MAMNVEMLRKSGYIVFETVSGSHAYGTNTPESDVDIRGIFRLPKESFYALQVPSQQVSDEKHDTTYYELREFFRLAAEVNPNIIELLFMPKDCVRITSPLFGKLIENRDVFISKKAFYTFSGYAYSQIKRAKGQNKWVNNPQPETHPERIDYCWFIDARRVGEYRGESKAQPCRPVPVRSVENGVETFAVNLEHCHASKMEHSENVYRLYEYGPSAKGVFRGGQLVCESIPKEDEWKRFHGLMIYNETAHDAAMKDWKNYWEWRKNRNEARYRSQEAGEIDYDAKSMMHCMRLLWSGRNILEGNGPMVRFEGDKLAILRDVRRGQYSYVEIMAMVESEMAELEVVKEKSPLQNAVNMKHIENLYRELGDWAGAWPKGLEPV
jgi:predicted nucleotidyltransferase